ncbi:uncharacterized protein M6B38_182765 [Iris pallida]|uniref:Uncharacterized protein n=1 Tax=Iris pallida TaxID=29817 RepID=A0AAX6EJX0_IRIPA|nr:uncharacterized protein M6B38_182765 [Iris pallida]
MSNDSRLIEISSSSSVVDDDEEEKPAADVSPKPEVQCPIFRIYSIKARPPAASAPTGSSCTLPGSTGAPPTSRPPSPSTRSSSPSSSTPQLLRRPPPLLLPGVLALPQVRPPLPLRPPLPRPLPPPHPRSPPHRRRRPPRPRPPGPRRPPPLQAPLLGRRPPHRPRQGPVHARQRRLRPVHRRLLRPELVGRALRQARLRQGLRHHPLGFPPRRPPDARVRAPVGQLGPVLPPLGPARRTQEPEGLREHDPLSSCLFVLAVSTFTTMLWKAKFAGLFRRTVGNLIWPNHLASLQYSTDALILAPADRASLVNMKLLLYFFELLSGLRVNFNRSCVYSLTGDGDASALAAEVLNCRVGKFPFIYMGMVLNSIELEIDEDCCILDYDPFDTTADEIKKKLSFSKDHGNDEEEEDISILAEKGPVACRDYPHSRHLCAKYPFKKTPHESYCPQCYCYVCDVVAPCSYWKRSVAAHCHATDEEMIWKISRRDHLDSTRWKEITGDFDGFRA